MQASFPISQPMVGSVIPGIRMTVTARLANYPDGSIHPLIKRRKYMDPLLKHPDMAGEHSGASPLLQKLQQLLSGGKQTHPHARLGQIPSMREGYAPVKENLQWRRS